MSPFIPSKHHSQGKSLILVQRKDVNSLNIGDRIKVIYQDLLKPFPEDVLALLDDLEAVIHLAAVRPDDVSPRDDFNQVVIGNILPTVNLLNALHIVNPPKVFIFASSIDVYPFVTLPVDENVLPDPISNYGASKLSCELICKSEISKWKQTKLLILRFSQIYGSADGSKKAITQFIRNALRCEPISLYGSGEEVRDYIYVADAVNAIVLALKSNKEGLYNISGGLPVRIMQTIDLIRKYSPGQISVNNLPQNKDKVSCCMNINKAKEALGYLPQFSIEDGIKATIEKERLRYSL